MQLDDFLAQRQAEAGAALLASDLDERLEDPSLLAEGNAFAIVFHRDQHPVALAPGLQVDLPAFAAMAQGVFQQVVDHPLDLQAIELQARQLIAQLQLQRDPAGLALGNETLLRLGEQVDEVAGSQFELLHAGLVARESSTGR